MSFKDLGAKSALADFGKESVFLTLKPSQEFFFFNLSWLKVDHHMVKGGGVMLQFIKWPWSRSSFPNFSTESSFLTLITLEHGGGGDMVKYNR